MSVTVGPPPCGWPQADGTYMIQLPGTQGTQILSQAQWQLCQARVLMTQGNYSGAAWGALKSLEASAGDLATGRASFLAPGPFLEQMAAEFARLAAALLNRVMAFLNWLKNILGQSMFWFLMIAGAAVVLYGVASDSDERQRA